MRKEKQILAHITNLKNRNGDMKDLICKICGDFFQLDWNDEDTSREICRTCEREKENE